MQQKLESSLQNFASDTHNHIGHGLELKYPFYRGGYQPQKNWNWELEFRTDLQGQVIDGWSESVKQWMMIFSGRLLKTSFDLSSGLPRQRRSLYDLLTSLLICNCFALVVIN